MSDPEEKVYWNSFFSQSDQLIAEYDAQLYYLYINPLGADLFGFSPQQMIGKTNLELLSFLSEHQEQSNKNLINSQEEIISQNIAHLLQVIETGQPYTVLQEFSTPEGSQFYEITYTPIAEHNQIKRIFSLGKNVSQYQQNQTTPVSNCSQTKTELQKDENLCLKCANSELAMICWDEELNILNWSSKAEALFGYPSQEILQNNLKDMAFIRQEDIAKFQQNLTELTSGKRDTIILRNYTKTQQIIWTQWYNSVAQIGNIKTYVSLIENITPAQAIQNDFESFIKEADQQITQHQQTKEALHQSEEKFRTFVENANEIIYSLTPEGFLSYISPNWKENLGHEIEEVQDKPFTNFLHPEDLPSCWSFLSKINETGQRQGGLKYRVQHKNGDWHWHLSNISPIKDKEGKVLYYIGICHDITETIKFELELKQKNRELEETLDQIRHYQAQLIHAEKMSSLGQLVAGVAHEINNPISFIYSNIDPLKQYVDEVFKYLASCAKHKEKLSPKGSSENEAIDIDFVQEDILKIISSIQSGAERIKRIVLSLQNFARLNESEQKEVDIHEGLESSLLILHSQCNSQSIEVIKDYQKVPRINCYPSQLNQVFFHLISNAIDAVSEEPAPRLIHLKTSLAKAEENLLNIDKIIISIKDNGPGIKPEHLGKIFEPFFTTKPVGKGSGLGLYTSYQIIVKKHGGNITCHSQPGEGTEFRIELPLISRIN